MTLNWTDLYATTAQPQEIDPNVGKLLELVPEERRPMAEPILTGLLSMVQAQLTSEQYAAFCGDMASAYELHTQGDADGARAILSAYGIDYGMLTGLTS